MGSSSKIDDSRPGESPFRASPPCRPAPAGSIVDLRNLLAERSPKPRTTWAGRLATGLPALDEAIGGGLPKGAITELTSPNISAGSAPLISPLLQTAHRERYFIALVDGRDSFDPQPLGNERLRHLLWVRCTKAFDAVKAADLLLRDGNFPLVILDLVLNAVDELRKIPQTSWYRLQRLAEPMPMAFLVLTRRSMISSAQLKLVLDHNWELQDLQRDECFARWKFQVHRLHGGRLQMAETG